MADDIVLFQTCKLCWPFHFNARNGSRGGSDIFSCNLILELALRQTLVITNRIGDVPNYRHTFESVTTQQAVGKPVSRSLEELLLENDAHLGLRDSGTRCIDLVLSFKP